MKIQIIETDPNYHNHVVMFVDGKQFLEGAGYGDHIKHQIQGILNFVEHQGIEHELDWNLLYTKNIQKFYYEYPHKTKLGETYEEFVKRLKKNFRFVKREPEFMERMKKSLGL